MSLQPVKIGLISLGCAKNLVDSEVMLGSLLREGMELTPDTSDADVVIVNTCGFIEASKQESIDTILKASALKATGRCRALIMAGCLTQRYPKDLQKDLPEVDAIIGLNEVPRIGEIVREVLGRTDAARVLDDENGTHPLPLPGGESADKTALYWSGPAKYVPDYTAPRFRLTPKHTAYVKIAEGCNHPCTFCSIPRIRGRHRSRTLADVVAEARALVEQGTRELNLISQDTTFYGRDGGAGGSMEGWKAGRLEGRTVPISTLPACQSSLSELLRALQEIPGDFWIRILYTHPAHWTDELITTITACDKVCRYVDMPLQHINDAVLKRMRRETDGRYIRDLITKIRAGIPGIALRTTFIVGFPGETEAQFAELVAFIESARFERLGIFTYSQEDHTPAGNLSEQVPARVRKQRFRRAMTAQQRVSRAVQKEFVGRTLRVLVENPNGHGWLARSHADAPEIDGTVKVTGPVRAGEFALVRVTGASEYDLVAEAVPGR